MLSLFKTDLKITGFLAALSLALALVLPGPLFSADGQVLYRAKVASVKLNLRNGPDQGAAVLAVMERGEAVDVIAEKGGIGGWLTVVFNGKTGYIRNRPQYVRRLPASKPGTLPSKAARTTGVPVKISKTGLPKDRPAARAPAPSRGAEPAQHNAADQKENLTLKIAGENEKLSAISKEEQEIIEGLDHIDRALNQARISADRLTKDVSGLEDQIKQGQADIDALTQKLEENRIYAGKRITALYKLGKAGEFKTTAVPGSLYDFFVRQNAMERIIESDSRTLEAWNKDLHSLTAARENMQHQITEKAEKEKKLRMQIRIKEKETQKKEALLRDIRRKKQLSLAALAALKESAIRLDQKMSGLGTKAPPAASREAGEVTRKSPFGRLRGRLVFPVKGQVVSRFGPSQSGDYKAFTFQKGIDIRVERGEPVRSVFKGEIMFADWLKGYGNLLIINHGDNYYTLYAHVEEMFKKKGERVDTGEVIATAGDTGSMTGLCLHFEIRHHGKPLNPMDWLEKGA